MEKLVLSVIAVIALHITFVLYMADIMSIGQNNATVRRDPARTAAGRDAAKPVDMELLASATLPAAEDAPDKMISRNTDQTGPRAARPGSGASLKSNDRRRPRLSGFEKPVPAFQASQRPQGPESAPFSDRIIYYRKAEPAREVPSFSAVSVPADDNYTPKPKKSLVAKLQYIYKKPWDLIKAVGSKLR